MVKSARRRNAKKTVGRKKSGTKGYRRKTMRKRQKGGVGEGEEGYLSASDKGSNQGSEHGTPPGTPKRLSPQSFSDKPTILPKRKFKDVQYSIEDIGPGKKKVTLKMGDGTQEIYIIPINILEQVEQIDSATTHRLVRETMVG